MRLCVLLKGSGLGRVKVVGGRGLVRVPEDDTDCASRDRPFVCIDLNLRRLVRGEFAFYWGLGVRVG